MSFGSIDLIATTPVLTQQTMSQKHFRILAAWTLSMAMLAPVVIAHPGHPDLAPAEGVMHLEVTYTEEAHIVDKTKNENNADEEEVSNFSFRTTAEFEQRVTMQAIADAGVTFYTPSNANSKHSGAVSYNGEIKRTLADEKHRPLLDEISQINFAGVLSEDSVSGVPDDNAAGIQFGLQANLTGDCKGKRTYTSFIPGADGEEKQVEKSEINSCGTSDESHVAALINRQPINLELLQLPNGKETIHYSGQFHVTSCNLNPQYCVELKAAEEAASPEPNSVAMSDNWIGANTSGSVAEGFKINLKMSKELKADGAWKRNLQVAASVMPGSKSIPTLEGKANHRREVADRLRALLI